MNGPPRRTLRIALPALLLALLVPGQAAALCCLGGRVADRASHAGAHGTPHHMPDRFDEGKSAIVPAGPVSDCEAITSPAPALRERDRADTTPGARDALLPWTTLLFPGSSTDPVILPGVPARSSIHRESPHPLRR